MMRTMFEQKSEELMRNAEKERDKNIGTRNWDYWDGYLAGAYSVSRWG